ncbi:hypothetical protein [Micromonospora auratinigra]|uniref:hypothetical protein n=1 Tax=Micromonospora auratinigra TaxID=261654 RepID=UPI0012FD29AB|nr:hypothetical protein [Micromonospora auratinigra]
MFAKMYSHLLYWIRVVALAVVAALLIPSSAAHASSVPPAPTGGGLTRTCQTGGGGPSLQLTLCQLGSGIADTAFLTYGLTAPGATVWIENIKIKVTLPGGNDNFYMFPCYFMSPTPANPYGSGYMARPEEQDGPTKMYCLMPAMPIGAQLEASASIRRLLYPGPYLADPETVHVKL